MNNFVTEIKKFIYEEWYNLKNNHKLKLITFCTLIILFPFTIPIIFLCFLSGILSGLLPGKKEYDKSVFKIVKNKSYFNIVFNKGDIAEYFTFMVLNNQPEHKKVLINLYIPTNNNTCEIDLVLINEHGIFVIESKGYSGWIFGQESDDKWKQVIYKNQYYFYNPIKQNRNHIRALANLLEIQNMDIFRSYIVFSQRCELKKICSSRSNLKVIKRNFLQETLNNDYMAYGKVLNREQIDDIYKKLKDYMCLSDNIKNKHIEYVNNIKTKNNYNEPK